MTLYLKLKSDKRVDLLLGDKNDLVIVEVKKCDW